MVQHYLPGLSEIFEWPTASWANLSKHVTAEDHFDPNDLYDNGRMQGRGCYVTCRTVSNFRLGEGDS